MGEGSYITLFSPSDVTAFLRIIVFIINWCFTHKKSLSNPRMDTPICIIYHHTSMRKESFVVNIHMYHTCCFSSHISTVYQAGDRGNINTAMFIMHTLHTGINVRWRPARVQLWHKVWRASTTVTKPCTKAGRTTHADFGCRRDRAYRCALI